ncbi:hypothetical protein QTP88_024849 [Uroleucon formosanum]
MKSTGRLHLQRNIRPAAGSDGPMKRLGVDLHNQIGFKGHKYDVRSSSFEGSGKVLPWTGHLLKFSTVCIQFPIHMTTFLTMEFGDMELTFCCL